MLGVEPAHRETWFGLDPELGLEPTTLRLTEQGNMPIIRHLRERLAIQSSARERSEMLGDRDMWGCVG